MFSAFVGKIQVSYLSPLVYYKKYILCEKGKFIHSI